MWKRENYVREIKTLVVELDNKNKEVTTNKENKLVIANLTEN